MRRSRLGLAGLAAALAAVAGAAPARAEERLTIALYAPNAPFDSGDARYSFVSRLAQQIQSVAGVATEPKAFARASDFDAAVKKGQVDFAVVDGVYLAERGVPFTVLAVATAGGDPTQRWALFAPDGGAAGIMDLAGKRLAIASTGGKDAQFVDNALLDGELPKHFGARQSAPDVASAVTSVALHKADCVFAPESLGRGGLKKVFDAGRVPNPGFVEVKAHAADLVAKVKQAVLAHGASGAYDGWKAGAGDAYRALSSRLGSKVRRPMMSEPDVVRLDERDVVVPMALEPVLPDPRDQFWVPSSLP